MTPSKETLEAQARHFANTAFAVGAGVLILVASLLQPHAIGWAGSEIGGHLVFIVATICIFTLGTKRPELALFAIERQCRKYGHVPGTDAAVCQRCFKNISPAPVD